MEKKSKKSIVIGITGLFLVTLVLLGLTYAYFRTRIIGNDSNEPSISVQSKKLEVVYEDGSAELSTEGLIEPGFTASKTFNIKNTGDELVEVVIFLDNVINTYERTEDWTYSLNCVDSNNNNVLYTNELEYPVIEHVVDVFYTGPKTNYTCNLVLKYADLKDVDQSVDMGKILKGKVQIYVGAERNPYNEGTLASAVFTNSKILRNYGDMISITGVATTDEGLHPAPDDYGTSWYFRGIQENNYVRFAGYDWRIVRINGDGSVRIILNDGLRDSFNNLKTVNYDDSNSNADVGYMNHGYPGSLSEGCVVTETNGNKYVDGIITDESSCINGEWLSGDDINFGNIASSDVKKVVDKFYEDVIKTNYADYLSDTIFCGDKELASKNLNTNSNAGNGRIETYYAASERLTYDANGEDLTVAKPTLICANNATNDYSRYTVNKYTTETGVETNGDLTYPIGLISADEIVFAGGWNGAGERSNSSYYLTFPDKTYKELDNLGNVGWWTMTPKYFKESFGAGMYSSVNNRYSNYSLNTHSTTYTNIIRPVINIKADVIVSSGEGTSSSPYQLTLS